MAHRQGGGDGNWHPVAAVIVAMIFAAPAVYLAVVVHPVFGPAGYVAIFVPLVRLVVRLLNGPPPGGGG